MNNIEIIKSNRNFCNICKSRSVSTCDFFELKLGDTNICLCTNCFRELRAMMSFSLVYLNSETVESEEDT